MRLCVNCLLPQPEKDFKARIENGRSGRFPSIFLMRIATRSSRFISCQERRWRLGRAVSCNSFKNGTDGVYAENALNELLGDAIQLSAFSYENDFVDEIDTEEDHSRVAAAIRQYDFAEQNIVFGQNSYLRIPEILTACGAKRPMLVCDRSSFDFLFLKDYLASLPYPFVWFDGFSPNPKYDEVKTGVTLFFYRSNVILSYRSAVGARSIREKHQKCFLCWSKIKII